LIQLLVGNQRCGLYGERPAITAMGLAIRAISALDGPGGAWGSFGATLATILAAMVFVGQIVGKWAEGGWVVLISLSLLILVAHAILVSPVGYRDPDQIYRIIRVKSRVQGPMGSIVEWQSLKTQEYRYTLLAAIARFGELFGVRRPVRYEKPVPAGDYEQMIHDEHAHTFLQQYLDSQPGSEPHLGGKPKETAPPDE
jgi:hypothetical protein